jgi:Mce-associated membrane protein
MRLLKLALALVAALLAIACAVVLIWPTAAPGESPAEKASDRDVAVQAASRTVVAAFLDVDYHDMDSRMKKVLDLSTGTFKHQYQTASVDLKSQVQQAKTVATSAILRVGIGEIHDDSAVVYVAADGKVTNTTIQKDKTSGKDAAAQRYYRFELHLSKVGDRWLLNDLQFIS